MEITNFAGSKKGIIIKQMETKKIKVLYETPLTVVFEVEQEGVICVSVGVFPIWDPEEI